MPSMFVGEVPSSGPGLQRWIVSANSVERPRQFPSRDGHWHRDLAQLGAGDEGGAAAPNDSEPCARCRAAMSEWRGPTAQRSRLHTLVCLVERAAVASYRRHDLQADRADSNEQERDEQEPAQELGVNRRPDAGHPSHESAERGLREQESIKAAGPRGLQDPPLIWHAVSFSSMMERSSIARVPIARQARWIEGASRGAGAPVPARRGRPLARPRG